jgi:apolipoprotein N-acyltransferase
MATAFCLFHKVKKATTRKLGYFAFIILWITMEYLHLNWDLSWPWLTLGNAFANAPNAVQWYEFTGFLGGSLWILVLNILLFRFLQSKKTSKIVLATLLVIFPVIISYILIPETTKKEQMQVLIVQPNIDPYTEKFNIGYETQLDEFIAIAKKQLTQESELLLGPETALLEGIWENKIEATYSVRKFRELQNEYPNLNILVGASTYKMFTHGEQKTTTARQIRNENIYYDAYNSAVFIPDSGETEVYHKIKLVPGVEKMPFPKLLDPLAKLAVELGGISGSLGSKNTIQSFSVNGKNIQPLICYESVYGDLHKAKTNLIAIITNDGWWKNTAGYKQHFAYSRLRAIEQRKPIVRSANTGISGVIDEKGSVLQKSKWNEEVCFSTTISTNDKRTFYAQFGDYIGRLSVFLAGLLLIIVFVKERLKK